MTDHVPAMQTAPDQKVPDMGLTPKLVSMAREGYNLAAFRADAIAGLTVAIVALPLSMAIAIASGAKPETGLYTAVVGGFIISALGGSRFQIGGPAGAFIVLVAATIETFGYQGFLLATIMAGLIQLGIGLLRIGGLIRYIPHAVIVGFTTGIAVIIAASQLHDFFGLSLDREPAAFLPKISALVAAGPSVNVVALIMALACLAIILAFRHFAPRIPGLLVAVVLAAMATWALGLPIETIGTRFGGVPSSLPRPALPGMSLDLILQLLVPALSMALLGGVESLLSAVVADGMSGRRHRPDIELVAQGIANVASALFGGICATGTIARTATNVRANAHGPVAGMLHSVFLLAFMLLAAPLASWIPLSALAAVLLVVAWNMSDRLEFINILKHDRGDAVVLLLTFLLTLLRDLTTGIVVGITLGALLFMHRMAGVVTVSSPSCEASPELDAIRAAHPDAAIFQLEGPLFFGSMGNVSTILERSLDAGLAAPKTIVMDLGGVPYADSSGMRALEDFTRKVQHRGGKIILAGARQNVRTVLELSPLLTQWTLRDGSTKA